MLVVLFCSMSLSECGEDDKRIHGQKIWQLVACGDRWRLWLWGHTRGEEPALHVLWRKPGCVRVEVLVAPPHCPSFPLTWSLDWDWTPATSQMLVKFVLRQVSLSTLPATVADLETSSCFKNVVSRENTWKGILRVAVSLAGGHNNSFLPCLLLFFLILDFLSEAEPMVLNMCEYACLSKFNFNKQYNQPGSPKSFILIPLQGARVCEWLYMFVCAGHTLFLK